MKFSIREMPELIKAIDQALDTAQQDAVQREFLDSQLNGKITAEHSPVFV